MVRVVRMAMIVVARKRVKMRRRALIRNKGREV
jgi:hypothetical protein